MFTARLAAHVVVSERGNGGAGAGDGDGWRGGRPAERGGEEEPHLHRDGVGGLVPPAPELYHTGSAGC